MHERGREAALHQAVVALEVARDDAGVFSMRIAASELPETIYYGYRVWGPNWPYDPGWQPGSSRSTTSGARALAIFIAR